MKRTARSAFVLALSLCAALAPALRAQPAGSAADSMRIAAIVAALDSAWAHADAARWAAHYVADAAFINILGIAPAQRRGDACAAPGDLRRVFKGSRHHGVLRQVRFLGPEADVDVEVKGSKALLRRAVPCRGAVMQCLIGQDPLAAPLPHAL